MNPFELITDDHLIYSMCQQWDLSTLINMSEAYKRVYYVCNSIIEKKKQERFNKLQILIEDSKKKKSYERNGYKHKYLIRNAIRCNYWDDLSLSYRIPFYFIPLFKIVGTYKEVFITLTDLGYYPSEVKQIISEEGINQFNYRLNKQGKYKKALQEEKTNWI